MRVLLAHDGSAAAAAAADLVQAVAWPTGSTIRVISVIEPTMVTISPWAGVTDHSPEIDRLIDDYLTGELTGTADRLKGADRTVETAVLRGRPATTIVDEANAFGAELVVMGSRGHGAIASLVLGSVSGEVVDHAHRPVLVARRSRLSRLVFATDGSPAAVSAQMLLSRWPIFEGLPIRVVSVADVPQPWHTGIAPTMYGQVIEAYTRDLDEAKKVHQEMADASVQQLRASGRDAVADVRAGDAATEVIASAADWGADLIVVGSRGQTGLQRFLLGSVARNVVHGSPASILVVHAAGPNDASE